MIIQETLTNLLFVSLEQAKLDSPFLIKKYRSLFTFSQFKIKGFHILT